MSIRYAAFTVVLVLTLLLAACTAPGADMSGEWTLTSINGQQPLAGSTVTAVFEDGRVGGQAGCNSYGGPYSVSGQKLAISGLTQTLMACMEPAGLMEQESAFLQALSQAAGYSLTGDMLEIQNAAGETILTFSKVR